MAGSVVGWSKPAMASHETSEDELGVQIVETFAGTGQAGFSGDGGPAVDAQLAGAVHAVATGPQGNTYITTADDDRVRKVAPDGTISTFAGTGEEGFNGNDQPATKTQLIQPQGLAVDTQGNVYIGESARVRKVTPDGVISTFAGTGETAFNGNDQPADETNLNGPVSAIGVDSNDNVYITERSGHRIRKITQGGDISTFAGTGSSGSSGDGGPASEAEVNEPNALAVHDRNVYIGEWGGDELIRKVDPSGTITTVADLGVTRANGLTVDSEGTLYIATFQGVHKLNDDGSVSVVAGRGNTREGFEDGVRAEEADFRAKSLDFDDDVGIVIGNHHPRVLQFINISDLVGITHLAASTTGRAKVGDEISYTAEVTNNGGAGSATEVTLTSELPNWVEFVSSDASQGSCSASEGTVTCNLGELAEGHSTTATITVILTQPQILDKLTATVTADGDDPFPSNNKVTTSPDIVVADPRCGEVLTEDTTLEVDIGPCPDKGLIVGADDITIDLNGHSVTGWRGYEGFSWPEWDEPGNDAGFGILGTGSNETGVKLTDRDGVTIKNGTVTGFSAGVVLKDNSSNNTVENLTVRENVGPRLWPELSDGIWVNNSPNNTIANNTVVDSGFHAGIGVWGRKSDDNTIVDNTVEGTPEYITIPSGYGIAVIGAPRKGDGMITGTKIANNTVRDNDGNGITSINNYDSRIANNVVENNDGRNQNRRCNAPSWAELRMTCWLGLFGGDGISVRTSPDAPQETKVTVVDNEVHGNSLSGIDVSTKGNKIIDNNAADNVTDVPDHDWFDDQFDLVDRNGNCDNNMWNNNESGDGGSSPDCTSTRGQ